MTTEQEELSKKKSSRRRKKQAAAPSLSGQKPKLAPRPRARKKPAKRAGAPIRQRLSFNRIVIKDTKRLQCPGVSENMCFQTGGHRAAVDQLKPFPELRANGCSCRNPPFPFH